MYIYIISDLISESIYSSIREEAGKTNSADNQSIPEPEPMQQDQSNHPPQVTETPSVAAKTLATLNEQIQSKRTRSNSRLHGRSLSFTRGVTGKGAKSHSKSRSRSRSRVRDRSPALNQGATDKGTGVKHGTNPSINESGGAKPKTVPIAGGSGNKTCSGPQPNDDGHIGGGTNVNNSTSSNT